MVVFRLEHKSASLEEIVYKILAGKEIPAKHMPKQVQSDPVGIIVCVVGLGNISK